MRKTDEELERDLMEAIRPLMEKWDSDYIEGMKALGYTEKEAWAAVGMSPKNEDTQANLFTDND
jgi:Holliday junction resolvasome RuvABC DNA-binding subunit